MRLSWTRDDELNARDEAVERAMGDLFEAIKMRCVTEDVLNST